VTTTTCIAAPHDPSLAFPSPLTCELHACQLPVHACNVMAATATATARIPHLTSHACLKAFTCYHHLPPQPSEVSCINCWTDTVPTCLDFHPFPGTSDIWDVCCLSQSHLNNQLVLKRWLMFCALSTGTGSCDIWEVDETPEVLVQGQDSDLWGLAMNPAYPHVFATTCDSDAVIVWSAATRKVGWGGVVPPVGVRCVHCHGVQIHCQPCVATSAYSWGHRFLFSP
jgi:hypothetical protein